MPGAARCRVLGFDAYGTLFDVLSVTALCDTLAPGHGAALAQLWRAKQLQYSLLHSMMARHRDFWSLTADSLMYAVEALRLPLSATDRERLMDAYLTVAAFPDVQPALQGLRQRGVRLAVLSNGAPTMLMAATEHAGIAPLLDHILSVEAVGVYKPSPRVYGLLAEAFDVEPRDIGFVSSNSWDIAGARSAGLTTVWLRRTAADVPDVLGLPADHTIDTLTDLDRVC